jgi:alkylation response protein AidB-like acyl-CoA dehydrogenase
MSVDTARATATRTAVPLIASGPEALRAAREFAASIAGEVIERDRTGAVPVRELAALDAVAQAKAFATEVAAEVASGLFGLTGASAADERHDLSRHWRNARTHGSHDPAAWKYHHVGNYLLNDTLPPNHGQL